MDFDSERLLRVLSEVDFEFVVIGGMAALAHGASTPTRDLDVAAPMTSANLERLLSALEPFRPRHATRPELGVIWQSANESDADDPNGWLAVELRGDPSAGNHQGVGARVELRRSPGGPIQVRVIGVQTHFLGQGENRALFGLGPGEAQVAELRVLWPSGAETLLADLSPRQLVVVDE